MKHIILSGILLGSTLMTACNLQTSGGLMPTGPSAVTGASSAQGSAPASSVATASVPPSGSGLDGNWASGKIPGLPNISTCTDLQWQISNQSGNAIAGSVSAVCGGVARVTASLTGEMSGSDDLNLTATGEASAQGITCGFTLTGVGHRETSTTMRLNYQGMTCLGPVSGSEVLRRNVNAPAPPPAPAPGPGVQNEPEPEPEPDDEVFGCTRFLPDKMDYVECVHSHIRPTDEYSGFEVTKRVAWGMRDQGAGLLLKPTGENIVSWRGYTFAAGRIMYSDGHVFKVLSDVGPGGANGPSWQDEGFLERSRFLPALNPVLR